MLKAQVVKDGKQIVFDFCDSWENIEEAFDKLDMGNLSFHLVSQNDNKIMLQIINASGQSYSKLHKILSNEDTIYDIYVACKKLQYGDPTFNQEFIENYMKYHSAKEVNNAYTKFLGEKTAKMTPIQKQAYLVDYSNNEWELMKFFEIPVLFSPSRVRKSDVPNGMFRYEIRHDDLCQGIMCQLAQGIMVNFWGTILSNKPIKLDSDGYRDIVEDKDVEHMFAPEITIKEYMDEYKPISRNKCWER